MADLFETQQFGGDFAPNRVGRPGKGGCAERHTVDAAAAVRHPFVIASEHFDVGEHMVSEADGLGDLQVGKAGHNGFGVLFRQIQQCRLKVLNQASDDGNLVAQPQADVGGDLVVAAAAGVQAFARVADFVGQAAFDVHMDIFQIGRPFDFAAADFFEDFRHTPADVRQIAFVQHAGFFQHLRVGQRALNVPFGKPSVETDGGGVLFDEFGNGFVETSGPGFVVHKDSLMGLFGAVFFQKAAEGFAGFGVFQAVGDGGFEVAQFAAAVVARAFKGVR